MVHTSTHSVSVYVIEVHVRYYIWREAPSRTKVDYSVLQFAEVGGRLLLTHGRYLSPTCKEFVFVSSNLGVAVL